MDLPVPVAYFPLTDRNLTSAYPASRYVGRGRGLDWETEADGTFGTILVCNKVCCACCVGAQRPQRG